MLHQEPISVVSAESREHRPEKAGIADGQLCDLSERKVAHLRQFWAILTGRSRLCFLGIQPVLAPRSVQVRFRGQNGALRDGSEGGYLRSSRGHYPRNVTQYQSHSSQRAAPYPCRKGAEKQESRSPDTIAKKRTVTVDQTNSSPRHRPGRQAQAHPPNETRDRRSRSRRRVCQALG